jgi:hypothetical protein
MSALFGFLAALIFGGAGALLSLIRAKYDNVAGVFVGNFLITGILVFFIDWLWVFYHRPAMILPGLIAIVFTNTLITLIVAAVMDGAGGSLSAAPIVAVIALLAVIGVWAGGYNSASGVKVPCPSPSAGMPGATKSAPHICLKAAYGIVHVDEHPGNQPPASTTSNLVTVTGPMARVRASNAMSYGVAGDRNYSSYLDLGPATLQMVGGHMWYAFPLQFQGAINKARLNKGNKGLAREPGYIMVSGEDPGANVIERYNGKYSMVVSLGGGQGSEPDRWARNHGYSKYVLDDPTLEIADDGTPYYTVSLTRPQLGWTFPAPVGVLLINANNGQITRYNLPGRGLKNPVPHWVDRVYSANDAENIANWYGFYSRAPYGGQGNSNRYQVSVDSDNNTIPPILVYTGDGHPSWRMLLTSFSNETSVSHIIEMDSETGAIQAYRPQQPMGIESTVTEAFASGSGVGAGQIAANHYTPAGLSLHVIYGHLTWMVSYEPRGKNPSFTGVGFVDAYRVAAGNVAFGATRAQALQNYLQQLAKEQNAQGAQPGQGGVSTTVTGTIGDKRSDTQNGDEIYYIELNGKNGKPDPSRVYTGTSQLGTAIVESNPGDHVIIRVLKITKNDAQQTMQSFTDQQHPLVPAGS